MDYFRYNIRYQPLDAVNLIFVSRNDTDALLNEIVNVVLRSWGSGLQSSLYLMDDQSEFRSQHAWRTTGTARLRVVRKTQGLFTGPRFHVRFWKTSRNIVACAHKEGLGHLIGSVDSFDQGKNRVAQDFRNAGWAVFDDTLFIGTRVDTPSNNGWATLIIQPSTAKGIESNVPGIG